VFDLGVVLSVLDVRGLVVLDRINKYAVFSHHAQLDNMVRKFHPLKRLVVVYVDLPEQID